MLKSYLTQRTTEYKFGFSNQWNKNKRNYVFLPYIKN